MLLDKLQYGIGIRRRIVFIFISFGLIIILSSFLFTRFWVSSFEQVLKIRLLKQGYSSVMSMLESKKNVLRELVVFCSQSPQMKSITTEADLSEARVFFESVEKKFAIDGVILLKSDGTALYEDMDLGTGSTKMILYKRISESEPVSGYWLAPNNSLWFFAAYPLMRSEDSDVRRGTLIFALAMNYKMLDELSGRLELKVELFHNRDLFTGVGDYFSPNSTGALLRESMKKLLYTQEPFHISVNLENNHEVYILDTMFRDFVGDPVALCRFRDNAPFTYFSHQDIFYLLWLAFLFLAVAFFLMLKFLTRNVTLPLIRLKKAIQEVASSEDLSKRLSVESEDEVGGLTFEFNRMLDTLDKMNKRIKRSGEELAVLYNDLLEQKRFTSEILSLAPSMVLMFLPDGRIKYANEAIEIVTGFKTEESVGRIWFDQFVPFADRGSVREAFGEILQGRIEKYHQSQSLILTKDDREKLILWNYSVLKNAIGVVTAIIAVGQDISEFKKIESELLKKMNDLERFYKVSMDREKIILSLKKQAAELKDRLNQANK